MWCRVFPSRSQAQAEPEESAIKSSEIFPTKRRWRWSVPSHPQKRHFNGSTGICFWRWNQEFFLYTRNIRALSYHCGLYYSTYLYRIEEKKNHCFKKANWEAMKDEFSTLLKIIKVKYDLGEDIVTIWENFKSNLNKPLKNDLQ